MTITMDGYVDLYPLEIASCPDSIPVADCLSDGLIAASLLNPIMSYLPGDDFSVLGESVILVHSHKGAAGYAVRGLQYDRTGSTIPKKLLNILRQPVKEILRAARCSTLVFGLLEMQSPFSVQDGACNQGESVILADSSGTSPR